MSTPANVNAILNSNTKYNPNQDPSSDRRARLLNQHKVYNHSNFTITDVAATEETESASRSRNASVKLDGQWIENNYMASEIRGTDKSNMNSVISSNLGRS